MCIEDLHWSDPASARMLDSALRSLAARPLMVLAFARPELRETFPNLWAERELTELRLPKLSARNCERLLDAIVATLPSQEVEAHGSSARELSVDATLRAWLLERADGNPFFLEELVRGLRERKPDAELPDSILGIVQARLDALGDEPKLVMRAASVFGQQFEPSGVRALLVGESARGELPAWLELLTEREVIFARAGSDREYSFRHALIRDAAYLMLDREQRTRAHRAAADWLE